MRNKIYKLDYSDAIYYEINDNKIRKTISNKNNINTKYLCLYLECLENNTYKELITNQNFICENIFDLNNINLGFLKLYNVSTSEIKHYNFIFHIKNMDFNLYKDYITKILINSSQVYKKMNDDNIKIDKKSKKELYRELHNIYNKNLFELDKKSELIKLLKR